MSYSTELYSVESFSHNEIGPNVKKLMEKYITGGGYDANDFVFCQFLGKLVEGGELFELYYNTEDEETTAFLEFYQEHDSGKVTVKDFSVETD